MGDTSCFSMGENMKKAIFFTIDALFGLVIAFLFLYFMYYTPPQLSVYERGADALLVLALDNSILEESLVQEYLDTSLSPFCGNLSIYSQDSVLQYSVISTGCTQSDGQVQVFRRSFYYDAIYYAELLLW
jgi:hypothetical protein